MIFGEDRHLHLLGHFFAAIQNLEIYVTGQAPGRWFRTRRSPRKTASYAILTLNYDCLLENFTTCLLQNLDLTDSRDFSWAFDTPVSCPNPESVDFAVLERVHDRFFTQPYQ